MFPPELICAIVGSLPSRHDLRTLCMVSHTFYKEAIPFLYKEMTDPDECIHFEFLNTLRHSSQLARFVKIYHVPKATHEDGITWQTLEYPLMRMINLKELSLHNIIPYPFPKDVPFQLDTLIWSTDASVDIGDNLTHIHEFMCTQRCITSLHWDSHCDPPNLPWGLTLKTLVAETKAILKILPGRTIVNLHWKEKNAFRLLLASMPMVLAPLQELQKLRALSMELCSLCRFAQALNQLEWQIAPPYLEGVQVIDVFDIYDIEGGSMLGIAGTVLNGLFPSLRKLIIRPMAPFKSDDQHHAKNNIANLYENYPNLVNIDLWYRDTYYQRWDRNLQQPLPALINVPEDRLLTIE